MKKCIKCSTGDNIVDRITPRRYQMLSDMIKEYNSLPIKTEAMYFSVTMSRVFDEYARDNGLEYMKDFIYPAFQEGTIYRLSDKTLPEIK